MNCNEKIVFVSNLGKSQSKESFSLLIPKAGSNGDFYYSSRTPQVLCALTPVAIRSLFGDSWVESDSYAVLHVFLLSFETCFLFTKKKKVKNTDRAPESA